MKIAVLNFLNVLNGTAFDAFEYFYRLWELNKDTYLILKYPIFSKDFLNLKYSINQKCFDSIIFDTSESINQNSSRLNCKFFNILKSSFDAALAFNSSDLLKINANRKICISHDLVNYNGIEYYDEFFRFRNYTHKLYFDIHKIYKHSNCTYIRCFKPDFKIANQFKPYKFLDFNNNFRLTTSYTGDFFKNFNQFVYIKNTNVFDKHPRIFSECVYQNIKCYYFNTTDLIDNSYARFLDSKNLDLRNIKNDPLIKSILDS